MYLSLILSMKPFFHPLNVTEGVTVFRNNIFFTWTDQKNCSLESAKVVLLDVMQKSLQSCRLLDWTSGVICHFFSQSGSRSEFNTICKGPRSHSSGQTTTNANKHVQITSFTVKRRDIISFLGVVPTQESLTHPGIFMSTHLEVWFAVYVTGIAVDCHR